jgi:hypothetical protein
LRPSSLVTFASLGHDAPGFRDGEILDSDFRTPLPKKFPDVRFESINLFAGHGTDFGLGDL